MSGAPSTGGGSASAGAAAAAALEAGVHAYFAALDALDVEATVALFVPDGELLCVTDGRNPRGHDELRAFFHGVVDGSRGMEHPVSWQAIDPARRAAATIQDYHDVRDTGAVYAERTCNFFAFAEDGRIERLRFWRGKSA